MELYLKVSGIEKLLGPIPLSVEPLPGEIVRLAGKVYVLKGGQVTGTFGTTPSRRVFDAEEITEPGAQP